MDKTRLPLFVRLVTASVRPLGLHVAKLRDAGHESSSNTEEQQWLAVVELLQLLEEASSSAAGVESVGANTCLALKSYRQLVDLYFGVEDLYEVACSKVIPHLFGSHLETSFRKQPDNTFRITLSLHRDHQPSFPFWALMLGHFRALPRHLNLPFAIVDVEFGDHFGEYIVVPPAGAEAAVGPATNVKNVVRQRLLDDLLLCAESDSDAVQLDVTRCIAQVPTPELAPVTVRDPGALEQLLVSMQKDLCVSAIRLSAYTKSGLWPIRAVGEATSHARLRRTLWQGSQAIACIDASRESSGDPSAINAELDEHAGQYIQSLGQLLIAPSDAEAARFSADRANVVSEPLIPEPPPSSRGRFRSARNSRVVDMAKRWSLTPRQGSVMALLIEGLSNKEIALRLGCSVGTIENHVTCILKRAHVNSRGALAAAFWDPSTR